MKFKDWFIENTLLSEINTNIEKVMNKVYSDPSEFPFKNMFDKAVPDNEKATRFATPLVNDPIGVSILRKIESEGYTINFKEGLITKGNRSIRLGKYILDKKSPFTNEEKRWWITRGNALEALENVKNIDQYAIIISRNPFDVVRMGDFEEIRNQRGGVSCHGPTGSYFDCAVADAHNSGAIAYVVKRSDLDKVDLNDKEIFYDTERGINGIKPISRLRIRRFVNKKNEDEDLAIPEQRLYGKPIPNFYETLRKTVSSLQSDLIDSKKDNRPRMKDYRLYGGHYQDTEASKLFNDFFGDDLDVGNIEHANHSGNMADVWDEECSEITRNANRRMDHVGVYAEVEESDGHVWVNYGGSFSIEFNKELFTEKFIELITEEEQQKTIDLIKSDISKFLELETGVYTIETGEIKLNNESFEISFHINPEDQEQNPDSYRSFADTVETDIDDKYDEIKQSLMSHLAYTTYPTETNIKISVLNEPHYLPPDVNVHSFETETQTKFKNLVFDFKNIEKNYDAYLTSRFYEPIFVFNINEYQPFIDNVSQEIEKLDKEMDPEGEQRYSPPERFIKEKMHKLFISGIYEFGKSPEGKILASKYVGKEIESLYARYEQKEKQQKYLFDEPEFKLRLQMTGYKVSKDSTEEYSPTNVIRDMFTHPEKGNISVVLSGLDNINASDFNLTNDIKTDNWTAFFRFKMFFNSEKFTKTEHEMFIEFAEFIDERFNELIKIMQSQLGNPLLQKIKSIMNQFQTITLKNLNSLKQTASSKNVREYNNERHEFMSLLYA